MLDLGRPRGLAELLGTTLDTFFRHAAVFLTMTAVVVAPTLFLVDGVWGRQLADGSGADAPVGAVLASVALSTLVLPAIVTALHVRVVQRLGRGEPVSVSQAMHDAAPSIGPAILATLAYLAGMLLGFIALILPGVWLSVRWFFAAQAAVVLDASPGEALRASARLVDGRWWRVLGISFVFLIMGQALGGAAGIVADFVSNGPLHVALNLIGATAALSVAALSGTLLFFSLAAETGEPAPLSDVRP